MQSYQRNMESLMAVMFLVVAVIVIFFFGRWMGLIIKVDAPKPIPDSALPATKADIKALNKRLDEMYERQVTTKTLENIDYRTSVKQLKIVNADRRAGNFVDRLDMYLAGSPLAGQGRTILIAAVDTRVDPRMIAAIAAVESSKGRFLAGSHNAWGRKAPGGGWESWSSWEVAIANQAAYLARWGDRIWSVYCVPPEPWGSKVRAEMSRV